MKIHEFIKDLKEKSEIRFNDFEIEETSSILRIKDDSYLEKPTWIGGDTKFVCLFIDLNKSSKMSFKKHPKTMAKIYDYFTQNIVDVFNNSDFAADYIDIKGDGAFGIFEGEYASYKAMYAAISFKCLFDEKIKTKFKDDENNNLSCKIGIHKDKILVKKIGKKGDYNEVWAGRLVNNSAKLSEKYKDINTSSVPIILSEEVYLDFKAEQRFGFYHCHNGDENILEQKIPTFKEVDDFDDETFGNKFYYTEVGWCNYCADNYIAELKK
jgi:class 3 adenylate cyclase